MLIKQIGIAALVWTSTALAASAGPAEYYVVDRYNIKQPLYTARIWCDDQFTNVACVEFARCEGKQLYSTVSTLSNAVAGLESGHTIYVWRKIDATMACEYAN